MQSGTGRDTSEATTWSTKQIRFRMRLRLQVALLKRSHFSKVIANALHEMAEDGTITTSSMIAGQFITTVSLCSIHSDYG